MWLTSIGCIDNIVVLHQSALTRETDSICPLTTSATQEGMQSTDLLELIRSAWSKIVILDGQISTPERSLGTDSQLTHVLYTRQLTCAYRTNHYTVSCLPERSTEKLTEDHKI